MHFDTRDWRAWLQKELIGRMRKYLDAPLRKHHWSSVAGQRIWHNSDSPVLEVEPLKQGWFNMVKYWLMKEERNGACKRKPP